MTVEELIVELNKHPKDSVVFIPYGAMGDRQCRLVAYDSENKAVVLMEGIHD